MHTDFLHFAFNGQINEGGPVIRGKGRIRDLLLCCSHPEKESEWEGTYTIAQAQSIASDCQKAGKIDSIAGDLLIQIVID